jgi:DNA-binding response OmpR family regulator
MLAHAPFAVAAPPICHYAVPNGMASKILIVDEIPAICNLVTFALSGAGYKCRRAKTGREAISIFQEDHAAISLVIIDVHLSDLSGADVVAALRQLRSDLPAIFMSGSCFPAELRQFDNELLPKPFHIDALLKTVSRSFRCIAATCSTSTGFAQAGSWE